MYVDLFGRCPFVTAQKVLQGKWSIVILHNIAPGPIRFNELRRRLPEMTHATLSKQLKQLQEYGLVIRKEYPQIPPKVEYSLSEIGEKFGTVLDSFEAWGQDYIDYMQETEIRSRIE